MPRYTDPDQDKTNPQPQYIHQRFDDEAEETARDEYTIEAYDWADEEYYDRVENELASPTTGVNLLENDLEESREEPFFESLNRYDGTYPDEYEVLHEDELDSTDEAMRQQFDIEGRFGTSFDPAGDEGEPEETRPLANE